MTRDIPQGGSLPANNAKAGQAERSEAPREVGVQSQAEASRAAKRTRKRSEAKRQAMLVSKPGWPNRGPRRAVARWGGASPGSPRPNGPRGGMKQCAPYRLAYH